MRVAEADARRLMPPRKSILPQRRQIMPKARLSSEQPLSVPLRQAKRDNMARNDGTFFTPHQSAVAHQMRKQNDPLGALGAHVERFLQLRQIGHQLASSFDPRTGHGIANIAGLFAGGPEAHVEGPASAGFEAEMPGQFERYSLAKSAAGGHLGHDLLPGHIGELMRVAREHPDPAMREMALRAVHDHFFGGEVHTKESIPPQP